MKIIQYLFNEPRTAHISFEGYDNISYQFDVASHSTKLVHKEDGNNFRAIGIMNTDEKTVPALQKPHHKSGRRTGISSYRVSSISDGYIATTVGTTLLPSRGYTASSAGATTTKNSFALLIFHDYANIENAICLVRRNNISSCLYKFMVMQYF